MVFRVVDEIYLFVASDPRLSTFKADVWTVREQARLLAQGRRHIVPIARTGTKTLPSREVAQRLASFLEQIPLVVDTDSSESIALMGQLLGNLSDAIIHAIFISFPDVMRSQDKSKPPDAS